jgi:inorganic phosphate transporter, PiT family
VERIFKVLQVVTACLLAFSHGSNDVSNAIGPFAAMYTMWKTGGVGAMISIPPWVLVLGGLGISSGLALFGRPVMETVGKKITKLRPTMGFSVELSTALTVLVASELGLPVSTTHTLIGCIVAIGLANGDKDAVNGSVLAGIAGSWGVTLPVSALFTVLFYICARPLLPVALALL